MNIRLDDKHTLNTDNYCCWITTDVVNKNGDVNQRRVSGYLPTIEQAVESFVKHDFMSSEAQTVVELEKEVKKLKQRISKWKKVLDKIGDAE